MSIPRIVHSCWFGGQEKPPLVKKCQHTWRSGFFADFDFMEWDENNTEIDSEYFDFLKTTGVWAYCADVARLWALYHHGGIYLDCDCEVVRPFTAYLDKKAMLPLGHHGFVFIHVIMAEPRHPFIKTVLDFSLQTKILHHINMMEQMQFLCRRHIERHGVAPVHFAHADVFHPYHSTDYRNTAEYRGALPPATRVIHDGLASWVEPLRTNIDKKGKNKLWSTLSRKAARTKKYWIIQKTTKQYPGIDKYLPILPCYLSDEEKKGGIV